uniref:NADH-ubiquinone oxidoreductase chain 4L n=1 Tax=Lipoptena sp. TaxID=2804770 RepID=A0A7U0KN96_9MUSC|nr:NADH dehydrogenase subunit 4L [Lipoptena sp.]
MNIFMFNFSMILFIMGILVFISNRKHLLSMLLSLEYIVLSLFLYLYMYLSFMDFELYFTMLFLTFSVCEGSLGISILVSMIRTHGNDYFQSFNII